MSDTSKQNDSLKEDQILRYFPTMLHRWHGGNAKLHDLTSSHRSISIHIKNRSEDQYLLLACLGPLNMTGPFQWNNSKLEVKRTADGNFEVYDEVINFSLVCEMIEIKEIDASQHQ